MTPHFIPALVNGDFQDPGLYLDFLFARRAILFDLGDLAPLSAKKLLRISDVCVSHTHIDHFNGFDRLLRICLGRDKGMRLFGPPHFLRQLESRLASYSWNLIASYPTEFIITAAEAAPDGTIRSAVFSSRKAFARESEEERSALDGILLDEENLRIRYAFLEHNTTTLGFALEEKVHVNIMKNKLEELGVPVGPWLAELKRAVLAGAGDDTVVRAVWKERGEVRERHFLLGELKEKTLSVVRGEKVAYVTDVSFSETNRERIVELARGADYFFIEATFLDSERERAHKRCHLTARQAGELARAAQVARVIPFHFSPRHLGEENLLRQEVEAAFRGE
ncbi:MBL fold metallo-hydrolase [Geomonas sp. RF6]|uniref:ribonuclease Z n=1 Tax=Geomonas sp. RF6 TaxID=2897342 RepID=UPI001E2B86AA|nr:MBL fold metallo-hydrolase [Geomonas sp. RF6]UFS71862.1 MBL fold metallo-hydrolase [Geomonas sp. RF6]